MSIDLDEARETLLSEFVIDPVLAHRSIFRDRHSHVTPKAHEQVIKDWHSDHPRVLTMAFRHFAKSTLAEEAICIAAGFGRTKNCLIISESEQRAAERLAAIKRELEQNEWLQAAFGIGPGDPWQDTRACTSTGVMIQAYGNGQSLRGVKYLEFRPDLIFLDDVESWESGNVATPEARRKTHRWFSSTVMPALSPSGRIRMAATPLHPEALAPTFAKNPDWLTRVFPLFYRNDDGELISTWPSMFPIPKCIALQEQYERSGETESFLQEYLCQSVDPSSRVFTEDMFRVIPRKRSYHAVYAIYDPARTTLKSSATTGTAVASWIGRKLVVWEAKAEKLSPDQIIEDIFRVNETYAPVAIGFEETGLNEWAMQPIRTEASKRGIVLPIRSLSPPRGKLDFIRGLQPFFRAGEIEFAVDLPELRAQLLGFPNGHIDAPNALAYLLKIRSGYPIYDEFREEFIREEIKVKETAQIWLLVNTDNRITTGILVQSHRGVLAILADWIMEGDAGISLKDILTEARLIVGQSAQIRLMAPRRHFDEYSIYGLRAAARSANIGMARGGDPSHGREEIRSLMRRVSHGEPALAVSGRGSWTLRGFAGGYARDADKVEPQANSYALLLEPLEGFAAILKSVSEALDHPVHYAMTKDGRRYASAFPG